MPRQGRSRPAAAPMRSAAPARSPVQHPPAPVQQPAMMQPMQPQAQQPSLFKQMAATAGGVAVGSAVGHVAGSALTGMFSGSGSAPAAQPQAAAAPQQAMPYQSYGAAPQQPTGPCAWEVSQFLQCAQNQGDLTLCEGFNEAIRQCKASNNLAL